MFRVQGERFGAVTSQGCAPAGTSRYVRTSLFPELTAAGCKRKKKKKKAERKGNKKGPWFQPGEGAALLPRGEVVGRATAWGRGCCSPRGLRGPQNASSRGREPAPKFGVEKGIWRSAPGASSTSSSSSSCFFPWLGATRSVQNQQRRLLRLPGAGLGRGGRGKLLHVLLRHPPLH